MFRIAKGTALAIGVLLLPVGYIVAYEALSFVLPPVIYTAGGVAIIILVLGGVGASIIVFEMVRTRIAQLGGQRVEFAASAQMALAQAKKEEIFVLTAPKDHQVIMNDPDTHSVFRQFHLAPGSHVNGDATTPTDIELKIYRDYHSGNASVLATKESLMIEAPQEDSLPLLPALSHADNILIVGGKGTGKTHLMLWIEASRIGEQEIVVMDSHAEPAQWQGRMVGFGREYEEIFGEMKLSVNELDRRYKHRAKGDKSYQVITSIIDEFTLLPETLKQLFDFDIKIYSRPLLTEGRKVKMNCVWGIHSDRVEALGMKGAGDLKECFDVIVHLKNVKGERYAICDFGEGKEDTKYIHPGPFVAPPTRQATPAPDKVTPDEPIKPAPGSHDMKVCQAWYKVSNTPLPSCNKLHKMVTQKNVNVNARQRENYRKVLRRYGIDPTYF